MTWHTLGKPHLRGSVETLKGITYSLCDEYNKIPKLNKHVLQYRNEGMFTLIFCLLIKTRPHDKIRYSLVFLNESCNEVNPQNPIIKNLVCALFGSINNIKEFQTFS